MLPVSLSRGALIAILACIFVLLGKWLLSILCGHAESTKSSFPGSPLELASTLSLLKRQERKAGGSKKAEDSSFLQGSHVLSDQVKAHRFFQAASMDWSTIVGAGVDRSVLSQSA